MAYSIAGISPAILLMGSDLQMTCIMLVSIIGGLSGVLLMIPLRRAFIVNSHG